MFANFIYFIIALLIYETYQPPPEPNFPLLQTLILFIGLLALFALTSWFQFNSLEKQTSRGNFIRLDHRYTRLITRQSILALVVFGIHLYGLNLSSFFDHVQLLKLIPTIQALIFLALFIFHLAIIWYCSHGVYRRMSASSESRASYVWSQISFSTPVLLPWLLLSGLADIIQTLPYALPKRILSSTEGQILYFLVFLIIVAMIGPAMIQKLWRCRPVEAGAVRDRIEALCRRAGIGYANIMYWPIFGGRMVTAGVMGLIKRFRYILVTRALLDSLEPDEIDAVIAHEIGHVKQKHLLFYLMFFVGYMLLTYAVYNLILYSIIYVSPVLELFTTLGIDQVTLTYLSFSVTFIALFLIYFRYIFGYFMRNFERQADTYVYALFDSARPLISTLNKIAFTSGQSPDRPNWHHFSITERINYLVRCENDRSAIRLQADKLKKSIAVYLIGMLAIGIVGYNLNFGEFGKTLSDRFFQKIVLREIDKHPQDPSLYRLLGDLYYNTKNWTGVQEAYERSLQLKPDNPHVLNNLAWLYATCEDKRFRDPERALMLAKAAAAISAAPHILDTLAESYYLNGYYEEAIAAETRARDLARENRSYYEGQLEKFRKALGY
jgi:Zn-dependent protease with chaperone function